MPRNEQRPATFNCRRITVGSVTLNVAIEGEGPDVVVLLHGFPDSHLVWRKQIPALVEAGYRVIAPDLRGFGDSDMPANVSDYELEHLVADLAGLLDALGIERVRLVGHDWGAVWGWAFCIAHPQRVVRYVAMSVGHPGAYARGGVVQKLKGYYVLLMQLRGVAEFVFRAAGWRFFRLMTGFHDEFDQWKRDMARPGRLTAALNVYRANLALLLVRERAHVAVPVMGVWSSGDIALAEKQMVISREYVDAAWRYERIDGASHWLQLDVPEKVNALLLDYLR